jgi:hypothetical protein
MRPRLRRRQMNNYPGIVFSMGNIEMISVYLKEKTFIRVNIMARISALPGGSRRIGPRLGAGGQHAFFVFKYYLPAAERAQI